MIKTIEEMTAQDIKALGDSVTVIYSLIESGATLTDEQNKFLKANVDHISIMLEKEHIVAYNGDKSSFIAAIAAGTAKHSL